MSDLQSFAEPLNVAVIGASGGIGNAFVGLLAQKDNVQKIYAFSRSNTVFDHPKITCGFIDVSSEDSIESAAKRIDDKIHIVIVASGILHDDIVKPEKSLRDLNMSSFEKIFSVNAFGPALVAKHFIPLLPKENKSVFVAISARVGSISDNHLGGWYAYRASKTALNMLLKTASIEVARRHKEAVIIGLHPNTVDTKLSKPFQSGIDHRIFTPDESVQHMLNVIDAVTFKDSGNVFSWDGQEIFP